MLRIQVPISNQRECAAILHPASESGSIWLAIPRQFHQAFDDLPMAFMDENAKLGNQ
jgi:hypothetical protein